MIFNSNDERPIQPVRIYRKHMGRCGEHQDIACAAARTALIPTVCTVNSGEDHVWNEFWDQRWVHWDANSKNNVDRKGSHDKDYYGGKDISSVWDCRGDGHIMSVTNDYTPTCTFTATVLDSKGRPVDGAEILIGSQNYYDPNYLTIITWGSTDYTGKFTVDLGNERDYWSSADTEHLGETPADSGGNEQLVQVISDSITSNSYSHTFNLPGSAPELDYTDAVFPEKPVKKYRMDVDYNVVSNILQGVNFYSREHFDLFGSSGNIDFFIANSVNFSKYNTNQAFEAFEFDERGNCSKVALNLPTDDNWYAVLSNEFSQRTTKIVDITVKIYGTLLAEIKSPGQNAELELDRTVTIKGTAFSPKPISGIEVDIDGSGIWQRATDYATTGNDKWSTWGFDWDTHGLGPGLHNIRVKATDPDREFITSLNVTLIDVTKPVVSIEQPMDSSSFKIGEIILVAGTAEDNVGVNLLELELNDALEERIDITESYQNGKWFHQIPTDEFTEGEYTLIIHTTDAALNYVNQSIRIILLEVVNPVVQITEPLNNSVQKLGSNINIYGKATDNKGIKGLEIVIDGNVPINITSSISKGGYWDYEWVTDDLEIQEGKHIIEVLAQDAAGNNGSAKIHLSLDGTPPIVNISKPLDYEVFSAGDDFILKGIAYDDYGITSIELIIDSGKPNIISVDFNYLNWTYKDLATRRLTSGEHSITIRATDLMGFASEDCIIIIIDAEEPFVQLLEQEKAVLIGDTITFEGLADDDIDVAGLELEITGFDAIDITSEFDNLTGKWTYTWNTSNMVEGKHLVTLKVTDIVGKQATDEITIKIISLSTDTDSDGMPDWWEMLFDRLDPNTDDARFDFDRDGFTSLEEYLGDDGLPGNDDYSDPTVKSSIPHIKQDKSTTTSMGSTVVVIAVIIVVIIIILLTVLVIVRKKAGKEEVSEKEDAKATVEAPSPTTKEVDGEAKTPTPQIQQPMQPIPRPMMISPRMAMMPAPRLIPPFMYPPMRPMPVQPIKPPKQQMPQLRSQAATGLALPPYGEVMEAEEVTSGDELGQPLKQKPETEPIDEEPGEEDPLLFLAETLMDSAQEKLETAKENGLDITGVEELFSEAKKALDNEDYNTAMEYAGKCKEEAEKILDIE